MSQTSYSRDFPAEAYAGMKADSRYDFVESLQAEEATGIPFGYGVVSGTLARTQCKLPDADTDEFRGIALHIHKEPSAIATEDAEYVNTEAVSVLRQGAVWAVTDGTLVTIGAAAYVETASGKLTGTAGSNIATGGVFRTVQATDTGLAIVEINKP